MPVQKVNNESIIISPGQILKTVYTPFPEFKSRGEATTFQIVRAIALRARRSAFGGSNLRRVTQVNLAEVARQSPDGIFIYSDTATTFVNFPVSAYHSGEAIVPIEENWIVVSGGAKENLVIGAKKRFTISLNGAPTEIQAELRRRL